MPDRPPLRRLPGRRYLVRLWARALTLYVVLRLPVAAGSANFDRLAGDATASRWAMDWRVLLVLFALVAGLVLVFANRRREPALLRNLGVDFRMLLAIAIAPVVGLEVLVQWWFA